MNNIIRECIQFKDPHTPKCVFQRRSEKRETLFMKCLLRCTRVGLVETVVVYLYLGSEKQKINRGQLVSNDNDLKIDLLMVMKSAMVVFSACN